MKSIECSERIKAPVHKVFHVATDLANAPQWASQIRKIELLTNGPVGVGTRFRETRAMFGKEASEEMEITGFQPNRSYTLGCCNHGCRYTTVLSFDEESGGTRVTMKFGAVPLTFLTRVMGFLMAPMMKGMLTKCLKQDLTDLKATCEKPGPA